MMHAVIVARRYVDLVRGMGHRAELRDLYRIGFDPCLKANETPTEAGYRASEDVLAEQAILRDVDVFALVYPLWFNAPPAILKGYVERVFDFGFAIRPTLGGSEPLLKGRKLYSITFSGAPETWLHATHGLEALRTIFDDHLAGVTGLQVVGHFHTGGIVPGLREDAVQDIFEAIDRDVRMCFPR